MSSFMRAFNRIAKTVAYLRMESTKKIGQPG